MKANIARKVVLVVDDTPDDVSILNAALMKEYDIKVATRGKKAIEIAISTQIDIILLDVMMPEMDGFETCRRLKEEEQTRHIPIIFITVRGENEDETKGLSCGGVDYIAKPISAPIVQARVRTHLALAEQNRILEDKVQERTAELTKANERLSQEIQDRKVAADALMEALTIIKQLKEQLREENIYLREEIDLIHSHMNIVGNSEAIRAVLKQVGQVAPTEATVLIQGETGTGKELLARAVHDQSDRKGRLMITVNCAALPPTLIESELFGREKGAFTGALSKQIGRFELADGSTIFLDEIDALPLELQAKLLRVLESGEFERLGNPRTVKVDVRIISATNRDLAELVSAGSFRQDMYYRLNIFQITVPPLRERREDIVPLVWYFIQEFGKNMNKRIESISPKSVQAMHAYPWPGNVRELKNVTERAMIVATGPVLRIELPKIVPSARGPSGTLEDMERLHIVEVLEATGWRVSGKNGAATILGLNPKTLESRMQKLGIQRTGKSDFAMK
ncbi:MAG: sigma 54-interacting transcriptional regulator [Proteobacteria bacterium]|nr:sigma 54-interacting transcriptional regulator [Pseudomonadota bacterium]